MKKKLLLEKFELFKKKMKKHSEICQLSSKKQFNDEEKSIEQENMFCEVSDASNCPINLILDGKRSKSEYRSLILQNNYI
jgi:hypothetical protein